MYAIQIYQLIAKMKYEMDGQSIIGVYEYADIFYMPELFVLLMLCCL